MSSSYYEIIDTAKLSYIINNIENFKQFLRASCFTDPNYCVLTTLKNILNACDENNILTVTYHQKNGKGRCMANMSLSYQSMIREVRHTLAKGVYVDVDMVCAHQCILLYLARQQGKQCPFLEYYIKNRDECLKPFKTREQGKKLYLALTNGGEYDYNQLSEEQKTDHLKEYANEMKELHILFASLYPQDFKDYKAKKIIQRNFKAGFMNTLLCEMENKILDVMIDYLEPTPKNKIVKCFDGVMMLNNKEYDILGCEKKINKVFKNINMKLAVKPFDEGLVLPEIIPKYIRVNSYIFDDVIQPSKKQLSLFKILLDEIEITKENAYKVILSSKNWSKCKKILNIIKKVFDNKDIHIDIRKIWNYIALPGVKSLSIAYLLMLHNESKLNKTLTKKHFQYFKMCSHINQLEGIENIKNIDIKNINQQYVTHENGAPNLSNFDMETLKNKIVIVKSHTGSGKTELMKHIAEKLPKHTFISLATRIILSEYHSDILSTNFYLDKDIKLSNPKVWERNGNISGMSCVIDSLVHIRINPNNKYVLFLDETSSIFDYIINKDNLKKKRRDIYNILRYLLINCEYCFCLDADINTHTINFISNILNFYKDELEINKKYILTTDKNDDDYDYDIDDCYNLGLPLTCVKTVKDALIRKDIILYRNNFKVNRCNINDYSSLPRIMKALISDIKNNKPLFICSDKNNYFYTEIFMKIITYIEMEIKLKDIKSKNDKRLLKDIKDGRFSFYSADIGNKDDFKDVKQLKNKVVFVSPVITTGVDLNYEAHVYGFYFGTHLTASTVVQQLGRIRKPININVFFSKGTYNYKYDVYQELEDDYMKTREELRQMIEYTRDNKSFDDIEGKFKTYSDFINEKLKSLRFHTLDILKHKGDNINYIYTDIDDFLDNIDIESKEKVISEEKLKQRFEYICNPNLFKVLNNEDIELLTDICQDDKKFNSHINFRKIMFNTEQDLIMQINTADDIETHNITARTTKIMLLKDLMNKLDIDITTVNYNDDFKNILKSKTTYNMKNAYIDAFRLSKHSYNKKLSKIEAHELVMTMINNLSPSFVSSGRIKIKDVKYRFKFLDCEKASEQINIFNRKTSNIYI